jgi:hypothetical protein
MLLGVVILVLIVLVIVGISALIKKPRGEEEHFSVPRGILVNPAEWAFYGSPSPYEGDGHRSQSKQPITYSKEPDPRLFANTPTPLESIDSSKANCTFLKNRGTNATLLDEDDSYTDLEQHRINWAMA